MLTHLISRGRAAEANEAASVGERAHNTADFRGEWTMLSDLVHENGALLATMASQISLTVSVDIQPADATATMHWIFPDRAMYRASLPHDVAWKSNVHR